MYKRLFTAALIFGAAALAPPLSAQTFNACLERSSLTGVLKNSFHELPAGAGLRSPDQMLELWTSAETGTFTVLVTFANGISCVIITGTAWQDTPSPPADATKS